MLSKDSLYIWLMILLNISPTTGLSFNQPVFSACAKWDPNGITFADSRTIGMYPYGVFVNSENTVYVSDKTSKRIHIWSEGSISPTRNISLYFNVTYSLFVTTHNDVYVDNGYYNHRVDKWSSNDTNSTVAMYIDGNCRGLFVDTNNTLYCSVYSMNKVVKQSLYSPLNTSSIVAGTGIAGSSSVMLSDPRGIFVDLKFDLYVADCGNNRIQLFQPYNITGTTIAGSGAVGTINLSCPIGLVLDGNGYVFIVDSNHYRVVGSGPNGFQCIVGCTAVSGSASNQIALSCTLSFDSYGNLYVTDTYNNRIQKFLLINNTCEVPTTNGINISTDQILTTIEQIYTTQNEEQSTITSTVTATTSQNFYTSIITLIPSTGSLSVPLQYERNQDIYISSYIQLNLNYSTSILTQWTISTCTLTCSSQVPIDSLIPTTYNEIYIPALTLPYGTYELKLTITMNGSSNILSSASIYVKIIPSSIIPNLIQFGTSMITWGYEQDLNFNPGSFSIDPNENSFDASDWSYEYYCRIYGLYQFPNINGTLLAIDDPRVDLYNRSCFVNQSRNETPWEYNGVSINSKSSVTIRSHSLLPNSTYQFMVQITNLQDTNQKAIGYLLVSIENTHSTMIIVACVISIMCIPDMEYQLVNPTTQLALFSLCLDNCSSLINIIWNIYYGINASMSTVTWKLFNQTNQYENIWFFGTNTSNFTASNQLFLNYPDIVYWQFQVQYIFPSEISTSSLSFKINSPPSNGSCSIHPRSGTINTLFILSCQDWFDEDGIKDYSIYTIIFDHEQMLMIGFSLVSTFGVYLPAGNENTSVLNITIQIRDMFECVREVNLDSIIVQSESIDIHNFAYEQLLLSGNQNTIGQMITSVSNELNQLNDENIYNAISTGIPATNIFVSPLNYQNIPKVNSSIVIDYQKQLNSYANIRDYLMTYLTNLRITTSSSIQLQASALAQITQATNQLTRTSSILASEKCHQLAQTLNSMSSKTSFENVQIAANQIAQCASNVLTSINSPLQQRSIVLDLDSQRANTFPTDYDTDLEAEWSNLKLFANGDDFSWQTIERNRNLYYQNQASKTLISQNNETMLLLTNALNTHLNIGQNFTINTSSIFMSLEIVSVESLSEKLIRTINNAQIHLPDNLQLYTLTNPSVSLRSIMQPLASSDGSSYTNLSTTLSLSIFDHNGYELPIQTTVDQPIELIITRDPNLIVPSMYLQNVTSSNSTTTNHQLFNLHFVNITSKSSISVHFEMHPLNISLAYLLIYKFDQSPQLNTTVSQIDGWTLLCPSNGFYNETYTYSIDNQRTINHQSIIFGLRELTSIDACLQSASLNPPIFNEPFHFSADYELRIYTSGCYYLNQNNIWQSDGLIVGSLTNHQFTQCFSTHLTTFAGGFLVLPAPVNWNYVFSNGDFAKNKTVYLTIICVYILYLLLIIYARYKDRKDVEKFGVTPLPDNHPSDSYFYEIIVFTGHRKDAGTNSKVHFVIAGEQNETTVRIFVDPHRCILQRGSIDAFIMAVSKSLGSLDHIRIWHDNSGSGSSASWFLKYIIVRDLQTMEKSYFICQNWLAVEKQDGMIERVLPVAGDRQKREFSYVLSKQIYHSISEEHLWFSIFSRPLSNKFTRVQRCTCCFVLLFTAMLLNILYYDQVSDAKTTHNSTSLSFGPFFISSEQIGIGIIVELLTFVPSLLLIQFFRRIRSRQMKHQHSPVVEAILKMKRHSIAKTSGQTNTKKRLSLTFPWWCLFIAYGISFVIVGVSAFFIIVRGIEFGDLKIQKWLTTLLSGLFSSIFLIQPIKVIGLTILFALFIRNTDKDKEAGELIDNENIQLDQNEEYLHSINENPFSYRSRIRVNRLDKAEVQWARQQRLKEILMWSLIREFFTYITFLALLYVITYSHMNSTDFYQMNHLKKMFLNTRQIDLDYTQITTIDDYWLWLEKNFAINLRAQEWYNGEPPRNLSGFIDDRSNRLIGWAMMRQLRVQTISCSINSICEKDYSFSNEEKQSFSPGWTNTMTSNATISIQKAFTYQTSDQLDTYFILGNYATYGTGGYVYEFHGRLTDLQSNLTELHRLRWIDSQTRAVIIQINLYNPNAQLFTLVTLLTEFSSTGGINPQARFEPISFQTLISISQLICTIFYMFFIIYMMYNEMQSIIEQKKNYFRHFWSYINIGIIVCSWTNVGILIWKFREAKYIGQLFEETNGYVYINLQMAVYINDIYVNLLGFCCFFVLFIKTLQYASKELISFTCMFSIVFTAFMSLFYLLFVSKLSNCSSLLNTAQMLFEMILMQFNSDELSGAAAFLGPFCFSLFIIIVVFVCMSMFFTIINNNFRMVRNNKKKLNDEEKQQHIYAYMFYRFCCSIGMTKDDEREEEIRAQYFHPIENFPEKIDQLLDALNKIYVNQQPLMPRKDTVSSISSTISKESYEFH